MDEIYELLKNPESLKKRLMKALEREEAMREIEELLKGAVPERTRELLEGVDLSEYCIFPGDVFPHLTFLTGAKVYPVRITPVFDFFERIGRVGKSDKCFIVLYGAEDFEVPKDVMRKINAYRSKMISTAGEIAVLGAQPSEKHAVKLAFSKRLKLARSVGKREDGSYRFFAIFSGKGKKIEPYYFPAVAEGGILKLLSRIGPPLGKVAKVIRHLSPRSGDPVLPILGNSSILEDGRVIPGEKRKMVRSESRVVKGDVVVTFKGMNFRVGMIEEGGPYGIDQNLYGLRFEDERLARNFSTFLRIPLIKEFVEKNMRSFGTVRVLYESFLTSLPVPVSEDSLEKIEEFVKGYEREIEAFKEKKIKDLVRILRSSS